MAQSLQALVGRFLWLRIVSEAKVGYYNWFTPSFATDLLRGFHNQQGFFLILSVCDQMIWNSDVIITLANTLASSTRSKIYSNKKLSCFVHKKTSFLPPITIYMKPLLGKTTSLHLHPTLLSKPTAGSITKSLRCLQVEAAVPLPSACASSLRALGALGSHPRWGWRSSQHNRWRSKSTSTRLCRYQLRRLAIDPPIGRIRKSHLPGNQKAGSKVLSSGGKKVWTFQGGAAKWAPVECLILSTIR